MLFWRACPLRYKLKVAGGLFCDVLRGTVLRRTVHYSVTIHARGVATMIIFVMVMHCVTVCAWGTTADVWVYRTPQACHAELPAGKVFTCEPRAVDVVGGKIVVRKLAGAP